MASLLYLPERTARKRKRFPAVPRHVRSVPLRSTAFCKTELLSLDPEAQLRSAVRILQMLVNYG